MGTRVVEVEVYAGVSETLGFRRACLFNEIPSRLSTEDGIQNGTQEVGSNESVAFPNIRNT